MGQAFRDPHYSTEIAEDQKKGHHQKIWCFSILGGDQKIKPNTSSPKLPWSFPSDLDVDFFPEIRCS